MAIDMARYLATGRVHRYWVEPAFQFTYYGFEWVRPWPGDGLYWHVAVVGLLALGVAAGAAYRVAAPLFVLGYAYLFLLDQTRYLNHGYLVILVAVLLAAAPAHRALSVDAWLRPELRRESAPAWCLLSLRLQYEVVLVFAGLVKLSPDWLRLEPMRPWLAHRSDLPVVGSWLGETWVVAAAAYGSIALHLVGAPMLLWRRGRRYAVAAYVAFHLANAALFGIGIFPWLGIALTLLFLDPGWPRRLVRWLAPEAAAERLAAPGGWPSAGRRRLVAIGLSGWFLVQVLVPMRHWLYPGDVAWTEEGHRFAWRMMLRQKDCDARFRVTDAVAGRTWIVDPARYLTADQVAKMRSRPDMVLQFAHHLAARWRGDLGHDAVEVRASVGCALNGRAKAPLVDPTRDLARVRRGLARADWILPGPPPGWPVRGIAGEVERE